MAQIEVVRQVAADPASLALLLSGPTGRELLDGAPFELGAPQRSGLGFRVDLATRTPAPARGRILIVAGDESSGAASEVKLTLSVVGNVPAVQRTAKAFLDALVAAAQARSSAA